MCEAKHYNMKEFISAALEYSQTRGEDAACLINRHLQLLSVTIDLSTFDPYTSVVSEFFVSLHRLLSSLEPRSALAWCCVNALSTACRNPTARNSLIHVYEFLPPLSRLLGDHLSTEKQIRLLSLLQELTCGIKISWQIPHLPHLMSTLTKWSDGGEEEIVTLSLGVLVNLCYKNLSAIYTFTRCVDIKKFVRTCMPLKGMKIEVHVCKLLILLEHMNGEVPEEALVKLVQVTFNSMAEAYKARDYILLRHIVEFFADVKKHSGQAECMAHYQHYATELGKLLDVVENNPSTGDGAANVNEPECMSQVFEFIHSLIELKPTEVTPFYPRLISIALRWIQTDLVCSQALSILRTIAVNTGLSQSHTLEPLLSGLPVFLVALDTTKEETPSNIEYSKRLGALMQLLKTLVQAKVTKDSVLSAIKETHIKHVFMPLFGNTSPRSRACDADTYSPEALNLFVHALAFVAALAKEDIEWLDTYTNLLKQKQVHMILAQGLYRGPMDVKSLVFKMSMSHLFPGDYVATVMCELQNGIQTEASFHNSAHQVPDLMFPSLSVTQSDRLDDILHQFKEATAQNQVASLATSDVMELYEYKLASMGHEIRALTASTEAASQRCTHLKHMTAQLTAELSRLHQLLFHKQQCHEDSLKQKVLLEANNKDLNNRMEAERGRYKAVSSQLVMKEKLLEEKERQLECLKEAENQKNDLKQLVGKLEENLIKKEKLLEKKEELLTRSNSQSEHYKMKITELNLKISQMEGELSSRAEELIQVKQDLEAKKQLVDAITKLTNSSFK